MIGAILGSEVGVFLTLLSTISQEELDPRQSASKLAILFFALLGLSILRRKTLPTSSER